ncbi:Zn-dependent metalloprotease [Aquimarina sp. EL_43]|nr:Zn-dependent metalloprotease [Aquimarina sp. EL_35]MBG6153937.1 Zn-dependent metalloprotease [Aquimarina sp. EL_32]MBG6172169.1 Zn-dependent metalloprotease [Aquimarina sp. EL_43]
MKKNFNVLVLMFILIFSSYGQEKYEVLQKGEQGMIPRAIKFDQEPIAFSTPENFMKQFFNIPPHQGILITEKNQDKLGFTHYRLQQTINGIPVDNSMYLIHVKDGKVITANGEWFSTVPASLYTKKSTLTSAQALEKAKTVIKAKKYAWEIGNAQKNGERHFMGEKVSDGGELVYFTNNNELNADKLKLAYKFDMYAAAPLQRSDVYVDASDGSILFSSQKIHSVDGTTDTGYHGQQNITVTQGGSGYVTRQTGNRSVAMRNMNGANVNYQVEPTNASLVTSSSTTFNFSGNDKYYMAAYWGMEKTWDMFSSVFNRSSYDGNGTNINLYVNGSGQQGDNNAFWAGTWTFFGNNTRGGTPFTPLDVVGHEIAHGVTGTSAQLRYQRESGALNEAFSDIFGAYVEYFAFNTINQDTWTLGDKIALKRSLSNPKQYNQPDTYGGTNWKEPNCGTPTGQNDFCGVHTNSGVLNH